MSFFIIPSGESYCNDRSKEFSKSRNTLKSIQSILRRKIAYDIMLAGKEIISPCGQKSESPRSCSFLGFLLILLQWIRNHQVRAVLLAAIQPFANIVGNYACRTGDKKRDCNTFYWRIRIGFTNFHLTFVAFCGIVLYTFQSKEREL